MRFWQKIFLISLTVLTVAVNIVAYMLIGYNHILNKDKEVASAKEMYSIVVSSFQTNVLYERYRSSATEFSSNQIAQVAREFSYQFSLDNLFMQLNLDSDNRLFSNFDGDVPIRLLDGIKENKNARLLIEQNEDNGKSYLYITSPVVIQSETYLFTTIKDISDIYEVKQQQLFFFSVVGPIASIIVALILLMVSKLLTMQINRLRKSTMRVAKGEYKPIEIRSNDEVGQLTADFNQMTEAVRQKVEQLESVAQARKSFIDNMTHEMKTPLTSIIGFSDLLRSARLDDETIHDYAESIYKEGKYLKSISGKLMDLILLRQKPELKPVPVPALVEEIAASVEPLAHSRRVRFTSTSVEYVLEADRSLIKSLIYNLIDNAIKASAPNTEVALKAEVTPRGGLILRVQDHGGGIPEEEQKKIFEPFYRVDKARSRQVGGAGLGLALCAEIAKLHGATLSIDSKLGKGTTISVCFPPPEEVVAP